MRNRKCVIIGTSINIAPARLALINADVNDGDYVILVGSNSDALNALAEFTKQIYQDFDVKVESIVLNQGLNLIDTVSMLRSIIEGNAPCNVVIGIASDRWIATILDFLAMTLATVGGFINVSVDRVFVMPGDKGEPVNWPVTPRLIDLNLIEYRVLRLICSGYSLAKEIVKGYTSKFNEPISLPAVERTLAKLRVKGLVKVKPMGKAMFYEPAQLGRMLVCA